AYPSHLAISDHWIVHYLSAGMASDPAKRAVEADWMARFDQDFATRHAAAFAALNRLFGLDYFGIDCAETRDGRLLIFEVDTAMIVHDMDDPEIFPYKQIAMRRLFEGFLGMVAQTNG
ncbi:tetratricopeptide repeat-containing protein, partial [Thioclava sp. BHET1]